MVLRFFVVCLSAELLRMTEKK